MCTFIVIYPDVGFDIKAETQWFNNTVELGYNVMKGTEYSVSL